MPHEEANQVSQPPIKNETLNTIQEIISSSNTAYQTNLALGLLIIEVRTELSNIFQEAPQPTKINDFFVSIETYAKTGRVLHSDTALGNQTLAMILLVLFEESQQNTTHIHTLKLILEHYAHHKNINEVAKTIIAAIENTNPIILPSHNQILTLLEEDIVKQQSESRLEQTKNEAESSPALTAHFYLNCMQGFCFAGGILLVAALLMSPLLAGTIGLTSLMSSVISTTASCIATGVGTASLLSSIGLYAYRNCQPTERARPSDLTFDR